MKKFMIAAMFMGFVVSASPAQANVFEDAWSFGKSTAKKAGNIVFTTTHTVLHAVRGGVNGGMDLVHSGLNWLGIPFQNGDGE